jgi:hypothetical protein
MNRSMALQYANKIVVPASELPVRFPAGPILRRIGELDDEGLRPDTALRLRDARLVFADHTLLQHDFPELHNAVLVAKGVSPERCDQVREDWLMEHAALMSVTQAGQEVTNNAIATEGNPRRVFRPSRYGRAFVSDTKTGLLDLKGTGTEPGRAPVVETHGNGLLLMRDGLREVMFQWIVDEIFRHSAPGFWTVPVYGFIDCGFEAKTRTDALDPVGIMVRRAHQRQPGNVDLPEKGSRGEEIKFEVELLFRHYGLTSSNRGTRFLFKDEEYLKVHYSGIELPRITDEDADKVRGWMRGRPSISADGVNIQTVREPDGESEFRAQLIDFGHYQVRSCFEDPVVSMAYGNLMSWGAALWPEDPWFPQPVPAYALPVDKWGFGALNTTANERPKRKDCEAPTLFAEALTRDFRAGRMSGRDVYNAMRDYIEGTVKTWPR